jgi:hypothetical protein
MYCNSILILMTALFSVSTVAVPAAFPNAINIKQMDTLNALPGTPAGMLLRHTCHHLLITSIGLKREADPFDHGHNPKREAGPEPFGHGHNP